MIYSKESKTATAPAWVGVLQVARSWGIPPWEIAKGSRLHWYLRQKALNDVLQDNG